jgi:3-deoxy-D-manno-octulosonate 8-phosphate phosphatase (KDO 8-P phosphatase)
VSAPTEKLLPIRLLAMDVDGVLTDGSLIWAHGPGGEPSLELKRFDVRDGLGIAVAGCIGLEIAWITGRRSTVVEARARELGVSELHQAARSKRQAMEAMLARRNLAPGAVAYIGDDLNDLPAFAVAGVRIAVADAAPELAVAADWITHRPGGAGAVREVIETLLRAQQRWNAAVNAYLARLETEPSAPAECGGAPPAAGDPRDSAGGGRPTPNSPIQ